MNKAFRIPILTAAALFVSACGLLPLSARSGASEPGHASCVTCHRTSTPDLTNGKAAFAGGLDPSDACLDCHHYAENHHPVDIAPSGEYSRVFSSPLPLTNGRIRCLTCHQAHTDAAARDLREPQHLLRGGPYRDVREFCFSCHYEEQYAQIDPHRMLDTDGAIATVDGKAVCLFCHRSQPERDEDPEDVTFRADVAFLCWRCHASMTGSFLNGHLLVKPRRTVRRVMRRTEREQGIILPLARDGMITCSTCHNPHQEGVISRARAQAGADQPHRLRMPREAICKACHST